MYNDVMNEKKISKPIILLALVAVVLVFIGNLPYFFSVYYDTYMDIPEVRFEFPGLIYLIEFILGVAPVVLLPIFMIKGNRKKVNFIPIIFALLAVSGLYICLVGVTNLIRILNVIMSIGCIFVAVTWLMGNPNKMLVVGTTAYCVLVWLIALMSCGEVMHWYLQEGIYLYFFAVPCEYIGKICFFVALLLVALKNITPKSSPVSPENQGNGFEQTTNEKLLLDLKDKFERGIITEEEYRIERAKIISRL